MGRAARGWTDLVITPERGVHVVDGLLTGFHEPRATHLAMLEAIAGRKHVDKAYAAALGGRYLWQLRDRHRLLVAWKPVTSGSVKGAKSDLLAEFWDEHEALPFANLNGN